MDNSRTISEMSQEERESIYNSVLGKILMDLDYLSAIATFLENGMDKKIMDAAVDLRVAEVNRRKGDARNNQKND